MNEHRWGPTGPPLEAYSRVTNPQRFASLHDAAASTLDRLERDFDVERKDAYGFDPELDEGCTLSRPGVALLPRDPAAAPLRLVFTAFPGLRLRLGRWYTVAFPACGCDACDETAESEIERLHSLIDNLTAGRFREAIQVHADGTAWKASLFWSVAGRSAEHGRLDEASLRTLLPPGDPSSYEWAPWPARR